MRTTEIDLTEDRRNLIDHYKYWNNDAILADLDSKRNNFSVVCCNFGNDFNIGTVIRNANAFLSSEVIILGRRSFDRRGAVGTQNYTHFKYVKTIDSLENMFSDRDKYFVVGIDNIEGAGPISETNWPKGPGARHTIMIFGQEDIGIPEDILELCEEVRYIPQYGSTRSINVGVASGIAMHDYTRKTLA